MKRVQQIILLAIAVFSFNSASAQYTENDIRLYIHTYKDLAINKMYEHKIPASITIAQGIFESACGTSHLAVDGNNHFGIKCHTGWTGDTILIDDDALQECFRKYQTVEESYNDHSLFLKTRNRYASLFNLDIMDYQGWARGLKAAGYATNPQYADRLINLIEKYNIARLDTIYKSLLDEGYFEKSNDILAARMEELYNENLQTIDIEIITKPHTVIQVPEDQKEEVKETTAADKNKQPKLKDRIKKDKTKTKPKNAEKEPKQEPKQENNTTQNPDKAPAKVQQPNSQDKKQEATEQSTVKPKPQPSAPATTANEPASKPTKTEPAPAHSVYQTHNNDAAKTVKEPANAATETSDPEELPTKISVFSTSDGRYPVVNDYPFTDRTVYKNNKVLFVIAKKGDTYQSIAKDVQSTEKKLKKYNDVTTPTKLKVGQVVYIEKKRTTSESNSYTVQNSESPLFIAQKMGIQLKKLCKLNKIDPKTELKKGKTLKLK